VRVKIAGQRVKVARGDGLFACSNEARCGRTEGKAQRQRAARDRLGGWGSVGAEPGAMAKRMEWGASGEAGGSRRWRAVVRGLVVKKLPAWCPPIRLRRLVCAQFRSALASPSIA
jgi:hypothetical protein